MFVIVSDFISLYTREKSLVYQVLSLLKDPFFLIGLTVRLHSRHQTLALAVSQGSVLFSSSPSHSILSTFPSKFHLDPSLISQFFQSLVQIHCPISPHLYIYFAHSTHCATTPNGSSYPVHWSGIGISSLCSRERNLNIKNWLGLVHGKHSEGVYQMLNEWIALQISLICEILSYWPLLIVLFLHAFHLENVWNILGLPCVFVK